MYSIDALLREAPVFAGLPPAQLELIAGCASNVHFEEGEVVFRRGDLADTFYLVREGSVALELFDPSQGSLMIETLEAGDVVGWSWLFPPYRWHFDGRTLAPVRATAFDGACLRGKCAADHALGYELMSRFAQLVIERLQATRVRLLDVYGRHV
jgi:CRP/FNR family cyclic AMP-dependent transcriptional regulator